MFFATAAKGTEPALRDELRRMRIPDVRADRGGVHFGGSREDAIRVCLHARTALRVLLRLGTFPAPSESALYAGVAALDFRPFLDPSRTLAVSASVRSGALTHSGYVALKTKDAIVDRQRDLFGSRPNVDRDDPDVAVFVHLVRDEATVYVDVSGESLHRRGYRKRAGDAPLKETLAAALLAFAGFDGHAPFWDPMCGSGTIAIEAAMIAQRIAPGLARPRFGFERWTSFDASTRALLHDVREEARAAIRPSLVPIFATDVDEAVLGVAKENAARANVTLEVRALDIARLASPAERTCFVINPPYGERLGLGDELRKSLARFVPSLTDHDVGVISNDPTVDRLGRRRPDDRRLLYNGDLECVWALWRAQTTP